MRVLRQDTLFSLMNAELQAGDQAPDFQAAVAGGGEHPPSLSLANLRGRRVVLCFYPYDDVPAATEQLDALGDAWEIVHEKAVLFGVSRDTVENHQRVIERLGLPFALLTDEDNRIAKAYGIWLGEGWRRGCRGRLPDGTLDVCHRRGWPDRGRLARCESRRSRRSTARSVERLTIFASRRGHFAADQRNTCLASRANSPTDHA